MSQVNESPEEKTRRQEEFTLDRPSKHKLDEIDGYLLSGDEKSIWKGAEALGEYVESYPEAIWPLVLVHGSSDNSVVRLAMATCVLEHILEHHFERYFSEMERRVNAGNHALRETLKSCWKFGQAEIPKNADRWDRLLKESGTAST